jgi:hypothetical protein
MSFHKEEGVDGGDTTDNDYEYSLILLRQSLIWKLYPSRSTSLVTEE